MTRSTLIVILVTSACVTSALAQTSSPPRNDVPQPYQDTGKAVPTGPDNFKILEKFAELQAAMRESIREPWKACLARISTAHLGK
jgi:hypothetical protein